MVGLAANVMDIGWGLASRSKTSRQQRKTEKAESRLRRIESQAEQLRGEQQQQDEVVTVKGDASGGRGRGKSKTRDVASGRDRCRCGGDGVARGGDRSSGDRPRRSICGTSGLEEEAGSSVWGRDSRKRG
ncbi:hypothetical protein PIB30_080592 [Stylosanthes scabra]|uniref:Uncharacterized protein n=1 Tax=Stylosanthes scabra TaxID=79078 RepID=A0ABU6QSC4_9FABA|nr:hypothetical protein [Stylosanthes scabra]